MMPELTPANVFARRKAAGLTQEAAGAMVGAARRTWQDWESGYRNMHPGLWELFYIKTAGIIGSRRAREAAALLNSAEQAPQPCQQPVD